MSFRVENNTIYLTRGDTFIGVVALTQDDEPYVPAEGDAVHFYMRPAGLNSKGTEYKYPLCLTKEIPTDTMVLRIESADTKDLSFGKYVYDIEITFDSGDVYTPITTQTLNLTPEVDE